MYVSELSVNHTCVHVQQTTQQAYERGPWLVNDTVLCKGLASYEIWSALRPT